MQMANTATGIEGVDVVITDSLGVVFTLTTDKTGMYMAETCSHEVASFVKLALQLLFLFLLLLFQSFHFITLSRRLSLDLTRVSVPFGVEDINALTICDNLHILTTVILLATSLCHP